MNSSEFILYNLWRDTFFLIRFLTLLIADHIDDVCEADLILFAEDLLMLPM